MEYELMKELEDIYSEMAKLDVRLERVKKGLETSPLYTLVEDALTALQASEECMYFAKGWD